jgi:hypothetical protein
MSFCTPSPRQATFHQVLGSFAQADGLPFQEVLTREQIEEAARAEKLSFATGDEQIYSPALTTWAWLSQAVADHKSCLAAVARVLVLLNALGRPLCSAGTGAYCKARAKLSEPFLRRLACTVGRQLEEQAPSDWRWHDHRAILVDGSTCSMPDTAKNQSAYPQPRSQRPGVGFPLLRWVALFGLATGVVLDSAFGPYRGKETGETALLRQLLDRLQPGDVVVADRYYCSYWMIVLLQQRGVHVVFRKHQLRHTDFRRGQRLGRQHHIVTWTKPQRPKWMTRDVYDALPATLTLREMRTHIDKPGCRVRELTVVTTLLDADEYDKEDIFDLYHERWHAEVDLRSLKTQMKMEVLRCQTPEMVRKEIWIHLLAYNLIRKTMAQAASEHGLKPRQLSFAGAQQILNAFRTRLLMATDVELADLCRNLFKAIASHRVGKRPGRWEPRKVKRRPKGYSRMLRPRAEERAACR